MIIKLIVVLRDNDYSSLAAKNPPLFPLSSL